MNEKNFIPADLTTDEFELLRRVKSTGKAEVAEVYDKLCRRRMLIKSGGTDIIENEARMLARFGGEGVPEVYGCFKRDGTAYLLCRFIEGKNLRERVAEKGKFSSAEAAEVGIKLCAVVSRLHGSDPPVVHRDIKPENVIITPDGEIFLVDFGIAREYDENSSRDTQIMGTPEVAPPEQFGYGQTDERSDVYSIGVLLREITAEPANKRLDAIIKRCTEFAPEQRYKNAMELGRALEELQKGKFPKAAVWTIAGCAAAVLLTFSAYRIGVRSAATPEAVPETVVTEQTNQAAEYVPDADGKITVEPDGEYPGDWNYAEGIPKSALDAFGGDVKVRLEIEIVPAEEPGSPSQIKPVFADDRWNSPEISTDNNRAEDGQWFLLGDDQTTFTFRLSRQVIDKMGDGGLDFAVYGVVIKSADIEPAAGAGFVTLDSEYPGDYELSSAIPKAELEKFDGDIKITLYTDIEGLYNYANFMPIALSGEDSVWKEIPDMVEYSGRMTEDGAYLELENGQTECTFILRREALELMNERGLAFRAVNVTIRAAELSEASTVIELDDEYRGDYVLGSAIPKSELERFHGDIRLTLDVETAGLYNYANFIPIALGSEGEWINLVNEIDCELERNEDGFISVPEGKSKCVLTLSREALDKMGGDGLCFQGVNVTIKSAELSEASTVIELDDEYRGDYEVSRAILKSELERFDGDILVTLDVETAGLYGYANFIPIATTPDGNGAALIDEIECDRERDGNGFIIVPEGESRCEFVLRREALDNMSPSGICFQTINVIVKSAELSDAENLQNS